MPTLMRSNFSIFCFLPELKENVEIFLIEKDNQPQFNRKLVDYLKSLSMQKQLHYSLTNKAAQ